MAWIYTTSLIVTSIVCAILYFYTKQKFPDNGDANFKKFQICYLVVYLFALAGDWLQGPYVYALYESYGMSKQDIELLFVAGFGASMVFGPIAGSLADKFGRRFNCLLYAVLYSLSCVTKHFPNFWALMVGRLLGGSATSILFSAFESWLVCEHNRRAFPSHLLTSTFALATIGNSLVAILSGVIAQYAVDMFAFVAPFDVAIVALVLQSACMYAMWSENYGNEGSELVGSIVTSVNAILKDSRVLCLGLIQSLFESAMYCFVLDWTPALTAAARAGVGPPAALAAPIAAAAARNLTGPGSALVALVAGKPAAVAGVEAANAESEGHRGLIPHGFVFAAFMVAVMIGSSVFSLLERVERAETYMRGVFVLGAIAMLPAVLVPQSELAVFLGFLVFEVCIGIFWPAMGVLRARYVPEASTLHEHQSRATVMNLFRCPLNLLVVLVLIQDLAPITVFVVCSVGLLLAAGLQCLLHHLTRNDAGAGLVFAPGAGAGKYELAPQEAPAGAVGVPMAGDDQSSALERGFGGHAEQRRQPSGSGVPVDSLK